MIVNWTDDGWRRRFAFLPMFLSNGPHKQCVWLERYWSRDMGEFVQVSLTNPSHTSEGDG